MDLIQCNITFLVEDTFVGLCWCYSGGTILPPVSEKLFYWGLHSTTDSDIDNESFFFFFLYLELLVLHSVLVFIRLQCPFAAFFFNNVSSKGWSRRRNKVVLSHQKTTGSWCFFCLDHSVNPYSKLFLTRKMFHVSLLRYPFNKSGCSDGESIARVTSSSSSSSSCWSHLGSLSFLSTALS